MFAAPHILRRLLTARFAVGFGLLLFLTVPGLLHSSDGAGLRCHFRGSYGTGGGRCRDDGGREYDVQLRAKATT